MTDKLKWYKLQKKRVIKKPIIMDLIYILLISFYGIFPISLMNKKSLNHIGCIRCRDVY